MRETLVLNATYQPLATVSFKRALVLVLQEKAVVEHVAPGRVVRAATLEIPLPRVIRLLKFVRVPFRQQAAWSRRGVLLRDNRRCAYCGGRATTVDHVLPRSRGGADSWLNTVAACGNDNQRKAARTPVEAGMRLLFEPYEPSATRALVLAFGVADVEGAQWLAEPVRPPVLAMGA
ncbi:MULTISPECIES: HNH endonuclease [unclassified Embleya]|uniref:HNH endonuclease n=1 Tax=unclassified Embleya TaxID=2699296 RepID=UPI00340AE7E3